MAHTILKGLAIDAYGLHHAIVALGGPNAPTPMKRALQAKLKRLESLGATISYQAERLGPAHPRIFDHDKQCVPCTSARAIAQDYVAAMLDPGNGVDTPT